MECYRNICTSHRKSPQAGLTQKAAAERLRRGGGRKVLPPFLNDLEHDRRYPPEDAMVEQLAKILRLSADVLYFYANGCPRTGAGKPRDVT